MLQGPGDLADRVLVTDTHVDSAVLLILILSMLLLFYAIVTIHPVV
jgi:hypothetical protein